MTLPLMPSRLTPRNLKSWLLGAFLLLSVVPLSTVGVVVYSEGEATLRRHQLDEQNTVAALKGQQLQQWVKGRRTELVHLASVPFFQHEVATLVRQAGQPAGQAASLRIRETLDRIRSVGEWAEMFLLDPVQGQILLSTDPEQEGKFKADRPYFREGLKGPHVQHVYYSLTLGKAVMAFSAPVPDPDGRPAAILVGRIDLRFLDRLMAEHTGLGTTGRTFLVNRFNYFVSDSLGRGAHGWRPVFSEGVQQALAGQTGTALYVNHEGRAVVGAYRWLPDLGLALIAEMDQAEALAPIKTLRMVLITAVIVVSGLAIVAGLRLAEGIVRPITYLVEAARAIGAGNLTRRVKIEWPAELATLASSVNQMAADLLGARHELEAYSRTLERRVKERTALEQGLFESAPDAILVVNGERCIVRLNGQAERLLGYHREELLGTPVELLVPVDSRDRHVEQCRRYISNPYRRTMGLGLRLYGERKDGSQFPADIMLSPLQTDVETLVIVAIRDITELQQAEEELQRQREALYQREKLSAMGSLLAGVAHELNNPLSVVLGRAGLFRQKLEGHPLAEEAEKIGQAAERCARIVKNFLALARQHPPERGETRLNQVVQEAVELLAYPLRVENVEVRLDLAEHLPALWGDAHQLHQVVVNLLSNAHDAMRQISGPRRLTVTTQHDPKVSRIRLEVADTGPGIPLEVQRRIFEPFFTTKPAGKGTGLGLSLCQGIVEAHGGSIWAESRPEQGIVFLVELPVLALPEAAPETVDTEVPPSIQERRILVVDDEPDVAETLADILAADGHHVETVGNGAQALDRLRVRAYDLILSDLRMPELDGPGLYRELARHYPDLLPRIVFITGDALGQEIMEFLEQTDAPRVSKPFELDEVRSAIRRVLG